MKTTSAFFHQGEPGDGHNRLFHLRSPQLAGGVCR